LFLEGIAAQRIGDFDLAARSLARLDSVALRLDVLDVGWALGGLSLLVRARLYEAMHSNKLAVEYYERFVRAWRTSDSLTVPLVAEANEKLRRLKGPP
jgi:hypothetical protein